MILLKTIAFKSARFLSNPKINANLKCLFSKRSSKSLVTKTFHKTKLEEIEMQQTIANEDNFQELKELKKYFEECEKDEEGADGLNDEFFDEGNELTQFDLNEGGESDFSEEFENAIENQSEQSGESKDNSLVSSVDLKDTSVKKKSKKLISLDENEQSQKKGMMNLRKKNINQPTFLEKKFGLNISSDPKVRQSDLQKFVLKGLQMLNIKEIQHLISIIEYFKSKLTTHSFKNAQNVHEDFFMRQIFKLFSNNKCEELMELFLKCDLIDLNMNLFMNNVSDYEKSYEIKNKFKQFDAFSKYCQPNGSYFLLNELSDKYNNIDYQKYSTLSEDMEEEQDDASDKEPLYNNKTQQIQQQYYQKQILDTLKQEKSTLQLASNNSSINNNEDDDTSNLIQDEIISKEDQFQKERQMFSKVNRYEDNNIISNKRLDSRLFDSLSRNISNIKTANKSTDGNNGSFQNTWSSSLLEDDFFSSQQYDFMNQNNQNSHLNANNNVSNFENDNFLLEPSLQSQQKVLKIEKQIENHFDTLIDDITAQSLSLPSIMTDFNSHSVFKLQDKEVTKLLNLESERMTLSTKKINKIHNNKMVLKQSFDRDIQQNDEIILLHQEDGLIPKKVEPSNWVYMFHLPYDLNQVPNYTNYIKNFVESSFGEIEEAQFINYKDFFEIEKINPKILTEEEEKLNKQLQEEFVQMNTKKTKSKKSVASNAASVTTKKDLASSVAAAAAAEKFPKKSIQQMSDEELLDHIYVNNKINPEFCAKTIKRTENILEKIQTKKEQKFNRSYAMIKFKSRSSKDACISPDIRLFGVQSFNEVFNFDDADFKKSLLITKIPWGTNLQFFINKINLQLKQCGLKHIKISFENVNLKKIITKYFIIIKFNSFSDALDVTKAFKDNDIMIENQKLSCNHCYGSLKQGPQGLFEVTDIVFGKDTTLLERVNERKVFEIWNIYKQDINIRDCPRTEDSNTHNTSNIELKEEELENYNDIDNDITRPNSSAFNTSLGFSKSSVFSQMKSIDQLTHHYYDTNQAEEEFLDFEDDKKKSN